MSKDKTTHHKEQKAHPKAASHKETKPDPKPETPKAKPAAAKPPAHKPEVKTTAAALPYSAPKSPSVFDIAKACYEAVRGYLESVNDRSSLPWDDISAKEPADSALRIVEFILNHPGQKPAEVHQAWLDQKIADGWTYGPQKIEAVKEHPLVMGYHLLQPHDKVKLALYVAITRAMCPESVAAPEHPYPGDNPDPAQTGGAPAPSETHASHVGETPVEGEPAKETQEPAI